MQESMANFGKCDSWCAVTVRNLKYERPSGGNPTKCPIGSNQNWELEVIVSLYGCVFVSQCSSGLAPAENGKASVLTLTFHSKLHSARKLEQIYNAQWSAWLKHFRQCWRELLWWAPAIVKVQRCVTTSSKAPAKTAGLDPDSRCSCRADFRDQTSFCGNLMAAAGASGSSHIRGTVSV